MFEFIPKAGSLVDRITTIRNVITFYLDPKNYPDLIEFEVIGQLKQCNVVCEDKNYDYLKMNDTAHVADLHANAIEQSIEHVHTVQCVHWTPEDVACFGDQLIKIQQNPSLRTKLLMDSGALIDNTPNLLKELQAQYPNINFENFKLPPPPDMPRKDFLSITDVENWKIEYNEYYKNLMWSEGITEIKSVALKSASYSALYSSLTTIFHDSLLAHNISKNKAEWMTHTVFLITLATTSITWSPLIIAVSCIALLKALQFKDDNVRFCSSVAATVAILRQNLPSSSFEGLKFAVIVLTAMASSTLTALVSSAITRGFWQKIYGKPNVDQTSDMPQDKEDNHLELKKQ